MPILRYEDLPKVNSSRWLSLDDLEGEEWRDIKGFEVKAQVSCYGRVKCKGYSYIHPRGGLTRRKPQIYKIKSDDRKYHRVAFYLDGIRYMFQVHRLVALAFIDNPQKFPVINHKDENPSNNCVYNLEWCTPKYNSNYGTLKVRQKEIRIKNNTVKPVVLYDYDGHIIKEYKTMKDAAIENFITIATIYNCCEGMASTAKGLHFRYKGDLYEKRDIKRVRCFYKVYKDSKLIIETNNCKAMCRFLGVNYIEFLKHAIHNNEFFSDVAEYEIYVESCNGESFKIINGTKIL